jgi:hypothetical protein
MAAAAPSAKSSSSASDETVRTFEQFYLQMNVSNCSFFFSFFLTRFQDYVEAGKLLLAKVNLDAVTQGKVERYSNYNAMWRHPTTGAILYVGNATAASNRRILGEIDVTRIVFCQG